MISPTPKLIGQLCANRPDLLQIAPKENRGARPTSKRIGQLCANRPDLLRIAPRKNPRVRATSISIDHSKALQIELRFCGHD
jgi:hypothetical protein